MPLPSKVDYSSFISFVRQQGWGACGMFAEAACIDIIREKDCPYSPNVSVNRMLWAWSRSLHKELGDDLGRPCDDLDDYLFLNGCPTEGSELTDSNAIKWPTDEGSWEAKYFKILKPVKIPLTLSDIKKYLAEKGPVRVSLPAKYFGFSGEGHFIALIGYDDASQQFRYINSWSDRWGDNGYGDISYNDLMKYTDEAVFYSPKPSDVKSVPAVRIKLTQEEGRQNVHLLLGIEGRPSAVTIWPSGQRDDKSRLLEYTVMAPRGFVWPPSSTNRIYLEIYDTSETGGKLERFCAAFCGQVVECLQLLINGPLEFKPHQVYRLTIPY